MSVGYLPHSFDVFNVAHLDLLASARERCDRLVVGVLDDGEVLARTGRPAVVPLQERLEIVANVRGVDAAVVHGTQPDLDEVDLMVPEDEAHAWPVGSTLLPAGRQTSSPVIRHALRPRSAEAVA